MTNFKLWPNMALVALFCLFGISGYIVRPIIDPCPYIASDTVRTYITKTVTFPKDTLYKPSDTIYLPPVIPQPVEGDSSIAGGVDSLAIYMDYYTRYGYDWTKQDTNIIIKGRTEVTQNRVTDRQISYTWLQPTQTIINSVDNSRHYTRYIYLGVDIPIKDPAHIEIEGLYTFKKGYAGLGYTPALQSINIKTGFSIIHFK